MSDVNVFMKDPINSLDGKVEKYKLKYKIEEEEESSFLAFYHVINSSHPPTRLFAAYDYPFAKYHLPRRKWKIKRPLLEFFKTFRSSKSVR